MRTRSLLVSAACWLALLPFASFSQAQNPTEADYYKLTSLPVPPGVVLEAGALELLPDGRLAASSRRGDIYTVTNPFAEDVATMQFTKFAGGLHEVLGLAAKDDWLYVTQRGELSRLKDIDGDGRADLFETVSDGWEIGGDYHEYAFGSKFDREGNLWVVLCLTGSFSSGHKYRGWCLRITPDGKVLPTCSGIRSPGGIGANAAGDMFYTDNQGPWNGTCGLKFLQPGSFQGHPDGNRWYELPEVVQALGQKPQTPMSGSRMMVEAAKVPELMPTAVLLPYGKMGQSASGIDFDKSEGKFGPFTGQLFVGDQTFSTVMRVHLEKINGRYQGVAFPFLSGIESGTLSVLTTKQGPMFVGGTNRGWGSRGPKPFSLQRIDWTGKLPFEIHEMRAKPNGFELTFTQPVDPVAAADVKSYSVKTYTYIYQASYGSPEVDHSEPKIVAAKVAADGQSVRLMIDGLQIGHVHEFHFDGIQSAAGQPLLHKEAYYTLNYIPEK